MRFKQIYDGEWIEPRRKNYYFKCCNCGLTHKFDFRIVKRGRIQYRVFRVKSSCKSSRGLKGYANKKKQKECYKK